MEEIQAESEAGGYPEGGWRACLVLLGAWFALLPASGFLQIIGTLQAYLVTHQLAGYSEAQFGWIFSVNAFLFLFGGVQFGTQSSLLFIISTLHCMKTALGP